MVDESLTFQEEKLKPRSYFNRSRFPVLSRSPQTPNRRNPRRKKHASEPRQLKATRTDVPKFRNSLYKEFQKIKYAGVKCKNCSKVGCSCGMMPLGRFDRKFAASLRQKRTRRNQLSSELSAELKQNEGKYDSLLMDLRGKVN